MKQVIAIFIVIALIGGGVFAFTQSSDKKESGGDTSDKQSEHVHPDEKFTKDQVAAHSTENDCWTIINGEVYDITDYIPRHPGGDEILRACGADGTSLFESRTTEDGESVGSGTGHSRSAQQLLNDFHVGSLTE